MDTSETMAPGSEYGTAEHAAAVAEMRRLADEAAAGSLEKLEVVKQAGVVETDEPRTDAEVSRLWAEEQETRAAGVIADAAPAVETVETPVVNADETDAERLRAAEEALNAAMKSAGLVGDGSAQ